MPVPTVPVDPNDVLDALFPALLDVKPSVRSLLFIRLASILDTPYLDIDRAFEAYLDEDELRRDGGFAPEGETLEPFTCYGCGEVINSIAPAWANPGAPSWMPAGCSSDFPGGLPLPEVPFHEACLPNQ